MSKLKHAVISTSEVMLALTMMMLSVLFFVGMEISSGLLFFFMALLFLSGKIPIGKNKYKIKIPLKVKMVILFVSLIALAVITGGEVQENAPVEIKSDSHEVIRSDYKKNREAILRSISSFMSAEDYEKARIIIFTYWPYVTDEALLNFRERLDIEYLKPKREEEEQVKALELEREERAKTAAAMRYAFQEMIKKNMHDPSSFRFVDYNYRVDGSIYYMTMKYRGKNAFGATILSEAEAKIDYENRRVYYMRSK